MANTPFIPLELAEFQGLNLAQLVDLLNRNFETIAQHNHAGGGREVPLSSVIANADLNMNENATLELNYLNFLNRSSSVTTNASIYFKDGELFCRDFSGREIQITSEGGAFFNVPGASRGPLWAQVEVLSNSVATGNSLIGAWAAGDDKPDDIGLNPLTIPPVPPDPSIIGLWVVVEIDGEEVEALFLPWRKQDGAAKENHVIRVSRSQSPQRTASFSLNLNASTGVFSYTVESRGTTERADSNTLVKIYPTQVRGAMGRQGPPGPVGNLDFGLPSVDTSEDIKFFVRELPVTTTTITPVIRPETLESGWGDDIWSVEPGTALGQILIPLGPDVVAISTNRIAYGLRYNRLAKNIWLGDTKYPVDWQVESAQLGGRTTDYSRIPTPLPDGPWRDLKVEFTDGSFDPVGRGTTKDGTLDKRDLHSLLDIQRFSPTKENIYPAIKKNLTAGENITITPNDSNSELQISAERAIELPPASDIRDELETLVGDDRLDSRAIKNLPAGGGGSGSSSWVGLSDTPASYSGQAGQTVKVNAGETGLEFGAEDVSSSIGDIIIETGILDTRRRSAGYLLDMNFPSNQVYPPGWRLYQERHSETDIRDYLLPPDLSGDDPTIGIWFESVQAGRLIHRIWMPWGGSPLTQDGNSINLETYSVASLLLVPTGGQSIDIRWGLQGTEDESIRFYSNGSSIPQSMRIVLRKVVVGGRGPVGARGPRGLQGPRGLEGRAGRDGASAGSTLIALDSPPSDLSPYALGQVLRVNSPYRGSWQEVKRNTDWGHGVQVRTAQGVNVRGFSLIGQGYGEVFKTDSTAEKLNQATSPVGSIEFLSDNTIAVRIKKSSISEEQQALSRIWMRAYNGFPSPLTDVSTIELDKQNDVTLGGVVYQRYTSEDSPVAPGLGGGYSDINTWSANNTRNVFFNFYTALPADTVAGQNANPFDFFDEKFLEEVDVPTPIDMAQIPTDLVPFRDGQVIRAGDRWRKIRVLTGFGHGLRIKTGLDREGTRVTNVGVNLVQTSQYGSIETIEGQALSSADSPVGRVVFQEDLGGPQTSDDSYTLDVFLKKSQIPENEQSRARLFMALYQDTPSAETFIDVFPIDKQAMDIDVGGVPYQVYTVNINQTRFMAVLAQHNLDADMAIEFYKAFTTYADRGEVFDIQDEKELVVIAEPAAAWAREGQSPPAGTVSFSADEADPTKEIKALVEETDNGSQAQKVLSQSGAKSWLEVPDFEQSLLNTDNDFKVAVEEQVPGGRDNRDLNLVASGQTFTAVYAGIRLTYNNNASESDLYQRYSVNVPLAGGDDTHAPAVLSFSLLKGGTQKTYSLRYWETDSGVAIYRSAVVANVDRITAPKTIFDVNILDATGKYLFMSADGTIRRTVDKSILQHATNTPTPVRNIPTNPRAGQRIQPLNDIEVAGGAVLTAEEFSTANSQFIGYLKATSRSAPNNDRDLGGLDPTSNNIAGLLSYPASHNNSAFANRTVFQDIGVGYNPSGGRASINGVQYQLQDIQSGDYWALSGLDGSFFRPSEQYYVNFRAAGANSWIYPNRTLKQGLFYFWNGLFWQEEKEGLNQEEVDARIDSKVLSGARTGNAEIIPASRLGTTLTQAQYNALTEKKDQLYFIVN